MSAKSIKAYAARSGSPEPSPDTLRAQAVKKLRAAQKLIEQAVSLNAYADRLENLK